MLNNLNYNLNECCKVSSITEITNVQCKQSNKCIVEVYSVQLYTVYSTLCIPNWLETFVCITQQPIPALAPWLWSNPPDIWWLARSKYNPIQHNCWPLVNGQYHTVVATRLLLIRLMFKYYVILKCFGRKGENVHFHALTL